MIFNRIAEANLEDWKKRPNRKPLIIRGARQVGKTTLVKKFAGQFKHTILLNLEKEKDALLFKQTKDVRSIVEALFLLNNLSITQTAETLLFIDEIQESPEAISMLRYFYEDYPQLSVIAAGSLLEFALKKVRSFPVGRVAYLNLYPLNFPEFLNAIDHQAAKEQIKKIPAEPYAHTVLMSLFNQYVILGGMPEVISTYIGMDSYTGLPQVYESIWGTYKKDVEKYATHDSDRKVIRHIMETAPMYLDKRIRFQNFGQSNYRSREVSEAFQTLGEAQVIQLIYPTTDLEVPVKPDLRKSPRLQFLDTGLINHELGIQAEMLSLNDLSPIFRGAVIPHLVSQELISISGLNMQRPCFWVREKKQSTSEIDLVYTYRDKVIPIEIKSGADGTLRSLHQFVDQCSHSYAVRVYAGMFSVIKTKTPAGKPYWLMNLPYYLGTMIPEYITWLIENYPNQPSF